MSRFLLAGGREIEGGDEDEGLNDEVQDLAGHKRHNDTEGRMRRLGMEGWRIPSSQETDEEFLKVSQEKGCHLAQAPKSYQNDPRLLGKQPGGKWNVRTMVSMPGY